MTNVVNSKWFQTIALLKAFPNSKSTSFLTKKTTTTTKKQLYIAFLYMYSRKRCKIPTIISILCTRALTCSSVLYERENIWCCNIRALYPEIKGKRNNNNKTARRHKNTRNHTRRTIKKKKIYEINKVSTCKINEQPSEY